MDSAEPVAPVAEAPSEYDELSAIYDKASEEAPEAAPEPSSEAPVEAKPEEDVSAEEVAAEPVEAPSEIPSEIAAHWQTMSPEARTAIETAQRDLSKRMAEQGRVVSASKPVYDKLAEASEKYPELKGMTPEQIGEDAFALAGVRASLAREPVQTVIQLARSQGFLPALAEALTGPVQQDSMAQQIAAQTQQLTMLQKQLEQYADPNRVAQEIETRLNAEKQERELEEVATGLEHWADVEPHIGLYGPVARQKLGNDASNAEVLKLAYDIAINAEPDLRAKAAASAQVQAEADPQKAEERLRAKSVNEARSQAPSKTREPSTEEKMAAVWDKYMG